MKYLSSLLLGMALAWPLFAAEALGPIIITPTRTPQSENESSATVYILTREQIERSGAVTTSQLLRGIPGVQIDDLFGNGTQVNVSLRGFSETANANTLVLVDGRRLNYSDTAGPDLHHVFPRDIERIEVLAGSAGTLYGDQAVGGIINVITRAAGPSRREVNARTGSFGHHGAGFAASGEIDPQIAYRVSAEAFEADHYRDNNAEENRNFSGIVEYRAAEALYFIEVQEIVDKLELPGALIEAELEEDRTQSNFGFAEDFIDEDTSVRRIGYERGLGEQRFAIDFTRRKTDADLRQSFRDSPSPEDGFSLREIDSLNPKLSGTLKFASDIPYVIGMDLEATEFDLEIPNVIGVSESASEQDSDSLYLQITPRLTDRLQLTVGLRRSAVENDLDYADVLGDRTRAEVDDNITVGELGLTYQIDESTRLRLRRDENFRFAKIDEFTRTEAGTILETQTGESLELGVEMTRGNHRLILSLYRLDLEDEIVFDPTLGPLVFGFPTGLNINLDRTRRDGITLSWASRISVQLEAGIEIGLVDARFESGPFDGNEISGVADELARLFASYSVGDAWRYFVEVDYRGPYYAQGDNANATDKLDSIRIVNAGLGYNYKAWDVTLRIDNLTDEEYAEFVTNFGFGAGFQPSPERNAMLSVGYRFE